MQKKHESVYPILRQNIQPFEYADDDGRIYIGLDDSLKLSYNQLLLPYDLFFILRYFDGDHSFKDLENAYVQNFSKSLDSARLNDLIEKLDGSFLLKNENSDQKIYQLTEKFKSQKVRYPICAGGSYAGDKEALIEQMRVFSKNIKNDDILYDGKHIKAFVAPHIDIKLAGNVYSEIYHHIALAQPADLYIILGIGHSGIDNLFTATTNHFDTPLGKVETDIDAVKELACMLNFDLFKSELVHRDEHSIEFQTVFLKHYIKSPFKVLPILCSFSPLVFENGKNEIFENFTQTLRSMIQNYPGKVCLVASVDLSHVGKMYGDEENPDKETLAVIEQKDIELLEHVAQLDMDEFTKSLGENLYNVCGYSALMTMMAVLKNANGSIINYAQADMNDSGSKVSFGGLVFT